MSSHRLEHQPEDGRYWCDVCRDSFATKAEHERYLESRTAIHGVKAKAKPRPPQHGFTPERQEALQSFIATMDEMLVKFEQDGEDHLLDVHQVDFRELEHTIRENPQILKLSVDMVMNQQHLSHKALAMGEARFVPNAYLIATIYCLQEIDKRRRHWPKPGDIPPGVAKPKEGPDGK